MKLPRPYGRGIFSQASSGAKSLRSETLRSDPRAYALDASRSGISQTTIIFSKNRACQLELLLRSLSIPSHVLYTYEPGFKAGYEKLIKMYPKVDFIKQTDFKRQLTEVVKHSDYILFLTDDDVMIAPFSENCPEFREFKDNRDVVSLSLGLSPKVAGKKWQWKDYRGNYRLRMWGYPMSVDSCIFRAEDILPTIEANDITNPNQLETQLNLNIPNRPLMMCFTTPRIVNNSVNQVQTNFPAHTYGITTHELEEKFLKGERLSLEDIKQKAKDAKYYRIKEAYEYESR